MNEFDTSSVRRSDLQEFLNHLDGLDISYDLRGDTLSFDETELDRNGQQEMTSIGIEPIHENKQLRESMRKQLVRLKVFKD